ncbi:MAG: TetR/AcrR family transcriptional regulator [Parvularculaceae bacterium]
MRKLRPQRRDNSASVRGQQTAAAILEAARDVLVEEGYPSLTMRNVAKRAGVTVGNLSYYYAKRDDLLHDLLEAVIQGYVEDFDRIVEDVERSPDQRLEDMIRFVIGDLATKETTGFFPALWGLAAHDPVAEREMTYVYDVERNAFARVVADMRPDLSKRDRDVLALFISASIEGHTMFIGWKRDRAQDGPAIANIAAHSFLSLVRTIDAASIRGLKPAAKSARRPAARKAAG